MTAWFDTIKGETLVSLTHNNSGNITLTTTNHTVVLTAVGDCCSSSWFEHVDDFDAVGGEITEWTNDEPYHEEYRPANTNYEYFEYQFMTLKTTKGRVHIEMRNSSNGYYGGYIEASVDGKRIRRW